MSRRHIPLGKKAQAMAQIATGVPSRTIAAALGVGKTTVGRWRLALADSSPHVKPGRQPAPAEPQADSLEPVPCAHLRIMPGRTCADCRETLPAQPPEWAQEPIPDYSRQDLNIASPSWHTF